MTPSLPGRGGGARPDALRLRTPFLAAALAAALSIPLHAPLDGQAPPERVLERLQASDPAAGDLYGCALSLDGTTLLVGSLLDDDRGPDSGSAYVYDLEPGGWAEGAKLVGSRTAAGDRFGFSVHLAREGNVQWALAGAPLAGAGGAGFLFARGVEGGEWRPAGRFDSPETGSDAGTAVALAGGRVLLGAPLADAGGRTDAGAVLVFPRPGGDDGGGSSPVRLEAPELGAGAGLGWSLDAAGDRVAAGAPWADAPLTGSGAVVLFRPTAGGLERLATVTAPDAAAFDAFGYSVALAGDLLVVGAPLDDDRGMSSGAVYVFRLGAGGAELESKIPGAGPGVQYGTSVAVAADARSFAVGLRGLAGAAGPDVGAVDVFERMEGRWVSDLRIQPAAARPGDEVGIAVSLSGDGIAAGAYKDDGGGADAGAAYVLAPLPREPEEPEEPEEPVEPSADLFFEIAPGGTSAVPGEPFSYQLTIGNLGPSDVGSLAFGSGFGAAFLEPEWTCSGTGGATCVPEQGAGPIAGTLELPAGGSVVYDLDVLVAPSARDRLVLAGGTGPPPVPDPDPSNNADRVETPLVRQTDLAVTLAVDPGTVRPGDVVEVDVIVTNGGPSDAFAARVSVDLPGVLAPMLPACGPTVQGVCVDTGGAVVRELDLAAGASETIRFLAEVGGGFVGPQGVVARTAPAELLADPASGDNRAAGEVLVLPPPGEVVGTKAVTGSFVEGGLVTYEIVVANGSEVPTPDLQWDEVIDELPQELSLVDIGLDCSAQSCGGLTVGPSEGLPCGEEPLPPLAIQTPASSGPLPLTSETVVWNGSVPAVGFVRITIEGMIRPQTRGSTVVNQAELCLAPDGGGLPTAGETAPPGQGEGPTTFTVETLLEIPVLSRGTLALLAALLAALALGRLRT